MRWQKQGKWFEVVKIMAMRFFKHKCGFVPLAKNCLKFTTRGSFSCVKKTIAHGSSSEQYPQSVLVMCSVEEIMALLFPPKENTPTRLDPVEPPSPMIELSLYSIVSNYDDRKYFNCMMSEM
ncbi:unnamed protein product [Prunus armeniaca]